MNKAVIVLVLTAAGASLACMHLVSELRDERARTEALQTRIADLERMAVEREQIASAMPIPSSPFSTISGSATEQELPRRTVAAASSPSETRSAKASPGMDERVREHFARQRQLMQDPKYREAMRKQQRVHMSGMYPGLEEALGLSAEEGNRFLDLLSQQQAEEMARAQDTIPWNPADPEGMKKAQDAMTQRQQRYQEEIDAQFGPTVRQKWTEYQETLGARHRVAGMQSQLALAGAPLNAEQSKAMLNALVEEDRRQMQEHVSASHARLGFNSFNSPDAFSDPAEWMQGQERSHERLLSALQPSLSSEQIEQVERIFAREREAQRASMELMRAQGMNGENVVFATGGFAAAPAGGLAITTTLEAAETEDGVQQ